MKHVLGHLLCSNILIIIRMDKFVYPILDDSHKVLVIM
jgi:hypothetical protein